MIGFETFICHKADLEGEVRKWLNQMTDLDKHTIVTITQTNLVVSTTNDGYVLFTVFFMW
jgi:hypothetical protein